MINIMVYVIIIMLENNFKFKIFQVYFNFFVEFYILLGLIDIMIIIFEKMCQIYINDGVVYVIFIVF